jgi:hypothetical protein
MQHGDDDDRPDENAGVALAAIDRALVSDRLRLRARREPAVPRPASSAELATW